MIKKEDVPATQAQGDSGLAIVSMVLGVVSLTGPGLLLGIPAIITASIALKKKLGGRGLSITGLVTGIISTVVSLLFLMLMIFLIAWGASHPDSSNHYHQSYPPSDQNGQPLDSSRT